MAATQWNDQEEEKLQGMHFLAKDVYLRCLRKFMNYDTGIVGLPPKAISYQMMAETCEFIPDRGSKLLPYKPTRNELRGAIRQLIRRNLIILISKRLEQPVYKLPFATINSAPPTPSPEKFEPSSEVGGFSFQEDVPMTYKGEHPEDVPEDVPENKNKKPDLTVVYSKNTKHEVQEDKPEDVPQKKPMTYIHQGSGLLNLTIPVQIKISEDESKQVPTSASKWCDFFTKHVRFQFHEVKTVNAMTLFRLWCGLNITQGEAVVAIEAAEQVLGKRPDTISYYKNFFESVVKNRNAKLNSQGAPHAKRSKRPTAEELAIQQLGGHRVYEHED